MACSAEPILDNCIECIDANGCWVSPGFIDFHTHYDAEIEFDPSLSESLRHGVTTVFLGSCSLSTAVGEPEDIADMFCCVEAVPRDVMLPMLKKTKTWNNFGEYFQHLEELLLGQNVTSYIGHSNVLMMAMGFERSVDPNIDPTEQELQKMEEWTFVNGMQEGLYTSWHENGQCKSKGQKTSGNPVGEWSYWDENGQVLSSADDNG